MRTSTAYDLTQFAPEVQRQVPVRVVKTRKRSKSQTKKAFMARFLAYVAVLTVLMAFTVYSKLQLTETKGQINESEAALTELVSENAYLSFQLESMVSLKNAEQYAVHELGLVKLDNHQIEYVNLNNENRIVTQEDNNKFVESWNSFFNLVIDFFGG